MFGRAEWRSRWRSHVVLAVVAALSVAAVLATLASATRSKSAFHRLRAASDASDLVIVPDDDKASTALEAVDASDGVLATRRFAQMWVRPMGTDYFPDFDLLVTGPFDAEGTI